MLFQKKLEKKKKRKIYLKKDEFGSYTEEDWNNFFQYNGTPKYPRGKAQIPGVIMDYQIKYKVAAKEAEGAWKTSKLTAVVDYLNEQL